MALVWNGDMAIARAKAAASLGVKLGAEHLLAKANETVPHLDGILEQSGTVDSENLEANVSYGGAADAYAVVQHEHVEFNHPGKGRAKWLELALIEEEKEILNTQAITIRNGLS